MLGESRWTHLQHAPLRVVTTFVRRLCGLAQFVLTVMQPRIAFAGLGQAAWPEVLRLGQCPSACHPAAGMFLRKRLPSGERQPESSSEGAYSDASPTCSDAELPCAEDATDDSALSHASGAAHAPPGPTSSFR